MSTSPRSSRAARLAQPEKLIFVALSLILAALLIYFALSSIPGSLRPTLAPTTDPSVSAHQ